jgi:hypothetical protein
MTGQDKRYPAFEDTDPMPFGEHKDELLDDVPARYLVWLWREGLQDEYGRSNVYKEELPDWMKSKAKLANYIWNSKQALEMEIGESI